VDGGIRFSLVGKLDLLTEEGFGVHATNEHCWALFPFAGIDYFTYGDSRDSSPENKEFVAQTYEGIISFKTACALVSIGELKNGRRNG
jgi:hypothetical protein